MRIIIFFDLPVETSDERREYTRFRKFLIKSGFVMMQESVYGKIVLNNTAAEAVREKVRKNKAKKGLIQMLTVTEKQYNNIELIVGEAATDVICDDSKLVIL